MTNLEDSQSNHPQKTGSNKPIIIIIIILIILALIAIDEGKDEEVTRPRATTAPRATSRPISTPIPQTLNVKYEVTGTTYSADLTYSNETENTEQDTAVLPWVLEFTAEPGQFLY